MSASAPSNALSLPPAATFPSSVENPGASPAAANGRAKLEALTGLRYFAAAAIFLHHTFGSSLDAYMARIDAKYGIRPDLGSVGMPLFFTLSGFLMYYNYFGKFRQNFRGTLRDFLVARFARIYPLYLFALLLSFSFMGNFFHDVRDRPGDAVYCLATGLTLTQSWIHDLVFQDYLWPRSISHGYLSLSWSVSVEVFFYVTFPFLCVPFLKRMTSLPRIAVAAALICAVYAAGDLISVHRWALRMPEAVGIPESAFTRWFLYTSPYGRYGEFLLGCLAGAVFARFAEKQASRRETMAGRAVLWGSIALILGLSLMAANLHRGWEWYALSMNIGYAPLCVTVIFCLARYKSGLQSLLSKPLFVLLGESSYGIYLLHPLVQSFYQFRTAGESEMHDLHIIVYNHLAMALVLHVFCLGTYQFIETPARVALRRWLGNRRTKPQLSVVSESPSEPVQMAA
jgi:peptidoglycan/LPS O-acetylase OafA/YrhL